MEARPLGPRQVGRQFGSPKSRLGRIVLWAAASLGCASQPHPVGHAVSPPPNI